MTRRWSVLFLVVLLATLVPATALAADPVVDWTRQFGTKDDEALGVAIDTTGRIVVAGGARPGRRGDFDAFVRLYEPDGSLVWERRFGTSGWDGASAVTVDRSGRVYVVGVTTNAFPGQTRMGSLDAFVRAYSPDGRVAWTRQFGTDGWDYAYAVTADGKGRVYVAGVAGGSFAGQTSRGDSDAFIRMYRRDGRLAWTRQFGTSGVDEATGIAVHADGTVAVAGSTSGTFAGKTSKGENDAFVRAYRPDGRIAWTRQFGTSKSDRASDVVMDEHGRVAVTGVTGGAFPGQVRRGITDAFVRTFRSDGSVAWTRQFGTGGWDYAGGIAVDGTGRMVVAGVTNGALPGQTKQGPFDAFVRSYSSDGSPAWTAQFGTEDEDRGFDVAADGTGRIAIAGTTDGTFLGQTNEGGYDAFVRTYVQP